MLKSWNLEGLKFVHLCLQNVPTCYFPIRFCVEEAKLHNNHLVLIIDQLQSLLHMESGAIMFDVALVEGAK